MLDSISTKDIDNIVGQFTSDIMETYINEAEMTDLDESIRSDKSIISYSFERELPTKDIDGLDRSIYSEDKELSLS
jgi:hypothetical protein